MKLTNEYESKNEDGRGNSSAYQNLSMNTPRNKIMVSVSMILIIFNSSIARVSCILGWWWFTRGQFQNVMKIHLSSAFAASICHLFVS